MWHFILPAGLTIGFLWNAWRLVRRFRREYYITEYLFFIRFPIILAAVLLVFPIVSQRVAPEMFGSLFVLGPIGIGSVVFFACMCTWLIVYSAKVLWYAMPFRAGLNFRRDAEGIMPIIPGEDGEVLLDPEAFYYLFLILPLVVSLIARADTSPIIAMVAAAVGFGAAVLIRDLFARFAPRVRRSHRTRARDAEPPSTGTNASNVGSAKTSSSTPEARYRVMGGRAKTFARMSLIIYAVAGGAGAFVRSEFSARIPALVYLLAALLVVNWAVGYLSFRFDKFRVPIVSLVILILLIWKSVWPSDHVYVLSPWRGQPAKDVREVLNDFAVSRDGKLVVVAASGGGITAALWTTNVLRALDTLGRSIDPAFNFQSHVALVSSVSGGSVGAMYYVDAFGRSQRPERNLDSVVAASGRSSLSAATWGMMYPDLIRIVLGEGMGRFDRAWAQERRWEGSLGTATDSATPTLASWSEGVRDGWRPVQIFNATIEETGERLLLAPVRLALADTGRASPALWREFQRLYPGYDVDVVTAARLSATFPFVTPHARPVLPDSMRRIAFHVADGGYYDNSGIVTALETISTWVNWVSYNHKARRIALVEIRAGGPIGAEVDKNARSPLLHSISGPLNTLFNVRTTSQLARNLQEITLVKRLWTCNPSRPELDHFVFRLSGDSPLSWHLTRDETGRIERHLGTPLLSSDLSQRKLVEARAQNDSEFVRLANFLVPAGVADTNHCSAQ